MNKTSLLAGLTVLSVLSASAETVIVNLGNSVNQPDLDTEGLGEGIDPSGYLNAFNGTDSLTFVYDLSGLGIGDANTLEIAVTGSDVITSGGQWGLAVEGGTEDLWYDVGETLSFVMTIKDSDGADITDDVDTFSFSGFSARGINRTNGSVTLTAAEKKLYFFNPNAPDLREKTGFDVDLSRLRTPYKIDSSRSGEDDVMQFSQLQFEIDSGSGRSRAD